MLTVIITATMHTPRCEMGFVFVKAIELGCITLFVIIASLLFVASNGTNNRVTRLKNTLTK